MPNFLTGTTKALWLRNLRDAEKQPVTTLGPSDAVIYTVFDLSDGAQVTSGPLNHVGNGNWRADIPTPAPGRYVVLFQATINGAVEKWQDAFVVNAAVV